MRPGHHPWPGPDPHAWPICTEIWPLLSSQQLPGHSLEPTAPLWPQLREFEQVLGKKKVGSETISQGNGNGRSMLCCNFPALQAGSRCQDEFDFFSPGSIYEFPGSSSVCSIEDQLHRRYDYFPQCLSLPKDSEKPVSGLWDRICPLQQISHQNKLVGVMKAKKKWVLLIHEVRSSRPSSAWMERMICGLKTLTLEWIPGSRCLGLF